MNKELLPIGSLIELSDGKKLIIISYEENKKHKLSYLCGGYPSYFLVDFIPPYKTKEFIQKYTFNVYNIDTYIDLESDYKIIHMGYKNNNFYELQERFKYLKLL